ncbi:MAG: GNAT family N-acetyltransferase [Microthrixaceae bacterium]|nr:GNAT family N-acetyltransferase [Microthrixaceae bacterium]
MTDINWTIEQPTLDANGIRLRPWRESDIDQVTAACQDAAIQRWTTVPVPYLRDHAVDFVESMAIEQWSDHSGALFCVASPDDRVLGSCGLVSVDAENLVAEVGYWVSAEARGAGVAQRSVKALAAWALGDGGMDRLEIYIEPANLASCRVAEQVGCVREGVLSSKALARGKRVDLVLYAMVP